MIIRASGWAPGKATVAGVAVVLFPSIGSSSGVSTVTANGQADDVQQVYGPRGVEVVPPYFHLTD